MTRLRFVASEAWRSITANVSTTMAAVLTVLVGMALVGILIGFTTYAWSWSDKTKKELVVHVYLCTAGDATDVVQSRSCHGRDATRKQTDKVAAALQRNALVGSIEFIPKEKAFAEERKKYPAEFSGVPSNPLPDAFLVKPKRGEQVEHLVKTLNLPSGVGKVTYGKKTAHKVLNVARLIEIISLVAVLILLSAAAVLIANTIRLSIFARRREVEVMKLVGASNWFVRGPFMLEGLLTGLVGAVLAVILLLVGKAFFLDSIWFHDRGVHALSFPLNALILVGLGLLLGAAGSGLTLRRFLRV